MEFANIQPGTYQTKRFEFGASYDSPPHVVGSIIGGAGVVSLAVNCAFQFSTVDADGAMVYFYNGSELTVSMVRIDWIAIG